MLNPFSPPQPQPSQSPRVTLLSLAIGIFGFSAGYLLPCLLFPASESLATGKVPAYASFFVLLQGYAQLHWPLVASNLALLLTNFACGVLAAILAFGLHTHGYRTKSVRLSAVTLLATSFAFVIVVAVSNSPNALPLSWSALTRNLVTSGTTLLPGMVLATYWLTTSIGKNS